MYRFNANTFSSDRTLPFISDGKNLIRMNTCPTISLKERPCKPDFDMVQYYIHNLNRLLFYESRLSQRERLQAELEYMERLRGIKRRREVLPHRAQLDLLMGGKKVEFNERYSLL